MKKYQNLDTFKKFLILEDKYQIKNLQNVDRESGKTRKKSGKSQGIPCQKFGRHPELETGPIIRVDRVKRRFLDIRHVCILILCLQHEVLVLD